MTSELALYILDTNDTRFMRVMDTSVYNPVIETSCERLIITAPGATESYTYAVKEGFNQLITTKTLYRQSSVGNLPDGIYNLNYSIAPNDQIWVEYNHLRIANINKRYFTALCSLQIDCNVDIDKSQKLSELRQIKMYIEAAKAYVEYCNSSEKGKLLYQYASDRLSKLECTFGENCCI